MQIGLVVLLAGCMEDMGSMRRHGHGWRAAGVCRSGFGLHGSLASAVGARATLLRLAGLALFALALGNGGRALDRDKRSRLWHKDEAALLHAHATCVA